MDPIFYENDYMMTQIEEIDFIRSPFYEFAKSKTMDEE